MSKQEISQERALLIVTGLGKIGYLIYGLGLGGAERELFHQVKALTGAGIEVIVFTFGQGKDLEPGISCMAPVVHIGGGRGKRGKLHRIYGLFDLVRRYDVRLIHSQLFPTNLYAWAVGRWKRIPGVGSIQNDVYSEMKEAGVLGTASLRWPRWMTANSRAALTTALRLGRTRNNTFLLENALDLEDFDEKAKRNTVDCLPGGVVAITVGNLRRQKRHDILLRALARARRTVPDLTCLIVGEGPLESELKSLADQLGLGPQVVRFVGKRQDVPALLQRAGLFVLASDHEGYPNAAQEAMAAGLPVVATRVGGIPEMVEEGVSGILVSPRDVGGLAEALVWLGRDAGLRTRMGANGRAFAEKHFSMSRLREDLVKLYSRVFRGHYRGQADGPAAG